MATGGHRRCPAHEGKGRGGGRPQPALPRAAIWTTAGVTCCCVAVPRTGPRPHRGRPVRRRLGGAAYAPARGERGMEEDPRRRTGPRPRRGRPVRRRLGGGAWRDSMSEKREGGGSAPENGHPGRCTVARERERKRRRVGERGEGIEWMGRGFEKVDIFVRVSEQRLSKDLDVGVRIKRT